MPLSTEQKQGLLQNSSAMLLMSKAILDDAQANKKTREEIGAMIAAAISMLTITMATLTQAIIHDMEESLIMSAKRVPANLVRPN